MVEKRVSDHTKESTDHIKESTDHIKESTDREKAQERCPLSLPDCWLAHNKAIIERESVKQAYRICWVVHDKEASREPTIILGSTQRGKTRERGLATDLGGQALTRATTRF